MTSDLHALDDLLRQVRTGGDAAAAGATAHADADATAHADADATAHADAGATAHADAGATAHADADADALVRLHERLVERAARDGQLDVAYRLQDSPVGPLLLAATPEGLVRVAFAAEGHDSVLALLAERVSPRVLHAPRRLDVAARELDEYFAGRRRRFGVPLDIRLARGFRRLVLDRLLEIAYGSTASYANVAAAAGNPKAVRAVGTACATNPLPLVIPCHRVVRSDGSLGNYGGGVDAKRLLLDLEGRG